MRTDSCLTDRAGSSAFPALAATAANHLHHHSLIPSRAASPMACPNRKVRGLSSMILIALVMAAAESGSAALKLEPTGTSSHFPPLLDCAPAPAPAAARSENGTAFRANVLSLLAALPSAAARAAATGLPATLDAGAGRARAFALGLCFGLGAPRGPSPGDCLECLSAAARDVVAGGCQGRRAGAWRAGCFLSYADTDAPTAREDAFRGWFYDDDAPTAALGSQCTANRTAAECSRCLDESARVVPAQLSTVHGDAVVVVGYGCYLRVPLVQPPPRWWKILCVFVDAIDVIAIVLIEVGGVLFCISKAREFNPA